MKKIFFDNSSTTKVDNKVIEEMLPYFSEFYGNPSSIHSFGVKANDGVDIARRKVADLINAVPEEIIFTSGGTEADNIAIVPRQIFPRWNVRCPGFLQ